MAGKITFKINGSDACLVVDPNRTLLDVLRTELGLKAAKYGCGMSQCGACTVMVDGVTARACVMRFGRVEGKSIITLEGLADPITGHLHPIQQAFVDKEGAQCGYCLNGMIMTALGFLQAQTDPTEEDIKQALKHHLCRCGTHQEIVAAVVHAARTMAQEQDKSNDG